MAHNNRTYAIINISDKDTVDFSQVLQDSYDTARKNIGVDPVTQFMVKWEGNTPSSLSGIIVDDVTYDHTGITTLLSGLDWSPEIDMI